MEKQMADIAVSFARNQWDPADFQIVKSPRFAGVGAFIQEADHIVNAVPGEKSQDELLSCPEAYCAMFHKVELSGDVSVASRMSFDHRMAPLIVIAPEMGRSADGRWPELREHYEVVLYDEGLNVWHHRYADGKPSWYRMAYLMDRFAAQTVYDLEVQIQMTAKGPQMSILCNGRQFGCAMPFHFTGESYWAGIIACEGVNRFYDYRVHGSFAPVQKNFPE